MATLSLKEKFMNLYVGLTLIAAVALAATIGLKKRPKHKQLVDVAFTMTLLFGCLALVDMLWLRIGGRHSMSFGWPALVYVVATSIMLAWQIDATLPYKPNRRMYQLACSLLVLLSCWLAL